MYSIDACLVCGESERTIVSKYNRFIFMESMWQHDLARFDYALCHGCGLVYATRRPNPDEYRFLYDNFNEFLLRKSKDKKFTELTPEGIVEMDAQFRPWWEIRSQKPSGSFQKILRTDLNKAIELLPQILPHVPLEGAKVLHIRAKSSTLGDIMKRVYGAAQADVITLFPHFAYLARKNEGVRAESCLNYEDFSIPFDEKYNLVIENHIFIHMLDPSSTFGMFASHLESGACLFFHNELCDESLFRRRKNLFAELRPFHYQQFDLPTLDRMFGRYGFSSVYSRITEGGANSDCFGVAKLTGKPGPCPRIDPGALAARLEMYVQWRDESILSLPKERCRALFGDEVDLVWERVRARAEHGSGPARASRALRRFGQTADGNGNLEIGAEIERQRAQRIEERCGERDAKHAARESAREARLAAKRARREAQRVAQEARRAAVRAAEDAKRTAKALRRAERDQKHDAAAAKRAAKKERRADEVRAGQKKGRPATGGRNLNAAGSHAEKSTLPGRLLRVARRMAEVLGRQRLTRPHTRTGP